MVGHHMGQDRRGAVRRYHSLASSLTSTASQDGTVKELDRKIIGDDLGKVRGGPYKQPLVTSCNLLQPPPISSDCQTLGLTLMGSKTQCQWSEKEETAFAAGVKEHDRCGWC